MASGEKCFSFTWKIENVDYWVRKDLLIFSPIFVVDSIDETSWRLVIDPIGKKSENFIGFYLLRSAHGKGGDKVSVKLELAFLAKDGSVLTPWKTVQSDFVKMGLQQFPKFQKRDDVFITKRSAFLPQDTLTARCRMWKCDGEMAEDVRCFARTRVPVEKRSFLWSIKDFSTLEFGKKYTYEIKSLDEYKQLLSPSLRFTRGLGLDEVIGFEVSVQDQDIQFATLILSLVDISGNKMECNREEFYFDESKSKEFNLLFTKNELMAMKSSYLPNDILSMDWQWVFSMGDMDEVIEPVHYASTISEKNISDAQNMNDQTIVPLSFPWNENLKSLYDEKFLCDVEIKTNTRTFYAHKVVLSASSSVFKAMFSSDMKEKYTNSVEIEDLSDDTISRMLLYIYTARIEDLTWERASLLYAAADKYAISNLKNICSSYMKDNLSADNACEVLLLSEFHADDDLKSFVQDYMLKHLKEIVNSEEWKLLMETNPKLAAETVTLPYK